MLLTRNTFCCGVKELHGITYATPQQVIKRIKPLSHSAAIIFTQADYSYGDGDCAYGDRLKRFIEDNGLGRVDKIVTGTNPNTSACIHVFVWTPDWGKIVAFRE